MTTKLAANGKAVTTAAKGRGDGKEENGEGNVGLQQQKGPMVNGGGGSNGCLRQKLRQSQQGQERVMRTRRRVVRMLIACVAVQASNFEKKI